MRRGRAARGRRWRRSLVQARPASSRRTGTRREDDGGHRRHRRLRHRKRADGAVVDRAEVAVAGDEQQVGAAIDPTSEVPLADL